MVLTAKGMEDDPHFRYSRWLASPAVGEEVVISGMSGRLPNSNTIHEFRDHLFSKRDMVSDNARRWKLNHPEIPQRHATVYNIDRLDAGFFGMHHRQADIMDPMMRIFMETAIEAVMDAGVNPSELAGSKTGVFLSSCWSDKETDTLAGVKESESFAITGYLRSFIPHRIAYYLKLKGPAFSVDTACSSSMNALNAAFRALRSGQCENAIVGCTTVLLHPGVSLQFFRLGVLSIDGVCRVFDQDAAGYVRGDTSACLFLQKAKHSKRVYAQIVNTNTNCDGFKPQGITFPSTDAQKQLMEDIYSESNVHPSELSFMEAHGTGTQVGDPEEVEAIDCALATRREEPLLVGSVKSSIGHTEPCSGIASIIKVLLAMSTGFIAPNINLKRTKKGMEGFEQGRMKVVTELTKLEKDDAIIGVNNFGFGGNNSHAILKRFNKTKRNNHLDQDDIPRLVCVSGRTEDSVKSLLIDVNKNGFNPEYVALLHEIYKTEIEHHPYRGYTINSKNGPINTSVTCFTFRQSQLYVVFGKLTKHFKVLGSYLFHFPCFRNTVSRMNNVLVSKNAPRFEECLENSSEYYQDILGSICVQIGIVDILKLLEIHPNVVYGNSCGKLVSAYYYGSISLEETVSAAVKSSHLEFDKDVPFSPKFSNSDELHNHAKIHDSILTQDLLRKSNEGVRIFNVSDFNFTDRDLLLVEGNTVMFLDSFGRLYEEGYVPQLHKLYPEIDYPVSRETEMISPSVQWDHRKSWYTYKFSQFIASDSVQKEYNISFLHEEEKFIAGHVIDGRNLVPATEYLALVWKTMAQSRHLLEIDLPVIFEDCKFIRAVTMPKTGYINILVTIQRGSGIFEVVEKNSVVARGVVRTFAEVSTNVINDSVFDDTNRREILERDEIYREMYLKGYNYSGMFKGIEKCNVDASAGLIKWKNNWCTFMDNMLQMRLLQIDSRLLFVPVGIRRVVINPAKHMAMAEKVVEEEALISVHVAKEGNLIRSGGIEIFGLQAKSISKKKQRLDPVLEKYEFVPNYCSLPLPEAVRINTQIILENNNETTFKAVEIVGDSANTDSEFLLHLVCKALDDTPVITPDLTISSKHFTEEIRGVKFEAVTLTPESNMILIVATKILQHSNNLKQILLSLNKDGFVLTREEIDFAPSEMSREIEIVTDFTTSKERLILFKIKSDRDRLANSKFIKIVSTNFDWLLQLKSCLKQDCNVTVYSRNEESSGILGLVKCIRREPKGTNLRCFIMMDEAPEFDPTDEFYHKQINKNLIVNVYKNHSWGTYRHLLLEENSPVECKHSLVNVTTRGDISSLRWLEGPLTEETPLEKDTALVAVYYSAVNFKDIMAASGRVNVETLMTNRIDQECLIGFEFSGRDLRGRRVMGMINSRAFASHVIADTKFLWEIPDSWTLEDAATVPVVYSTVMYALLMVEDLKIGSSILIHSGTGGIGLAALNVCLYHKCDIYVTVGTEEKRKYLRKHYPQIPESHIGNSRDTSFEEMIRTGTNGRGVDVILNSLSDDKLKASVRCLAQGGRFMEIGKYDLGNDTSLSLLLMEKEASYHGLMLDKIVTDSPELKIKIVKAIYDGIQAGFIKPLPRHVFDTEEVESSFRYMMTGKHMGKVLIKVRDEEKGKVIVPENRQFKALPRFNCDVRLSYVIIGGLGGVGLELADWLILRGAKKLILVSRSGIQSGYQLQRIRAWESYGVEVQISTKDVTKKQGCVHLIQEANRLAPVDAVFNLAVVLKDALLEDQAEENFVDSLAPKARTTKYLDEVTRKLCPKLRYFVVFSSVSCGRGNIGQSNYGMANAIMEEICEKRKREGLPALAIQWGAIGDVGLVAKMQKEKEEFVIGGTLQQRISNCLEMLDRFLKQNHPIVASMVVAEKYSRDIHSSPVEAVAFILGIKNMKTVSQHANLAELGMDSMMGTEVINVLEKDFDIYVTPRDIRSVTFAKLEELETERKNSAKVKDIDKAQQGVNMFIQLIPDSSVSHLPIIKLDSLISGDQECSSVFILPGIEGVFKPLDSLTKHLKAYVLGVQYKHENPECTIREVAETTVVHIENNLLINQRFFLIGYSFGALVALETASLLESKGYTGKIVLIDASPTYLSASAKTYLPEDEEAEFQSNLILKLIALLLPLDTLLQFKDPLLKCNTFSDRVDLVLALIPPEVSNKHKLEKQAFITLYKRLKAIFNYEFVNKKIASPIHLFKARYPMIDEEEDYKLSKLCEREIGVITVDGDHVSILNHPKLIEEINKIIND